MSSRINSCISIVNVAAYVGKPPKPPVDSMADLQPFIDAMVTKRRPPKGEPYTPNPERGLIIYALVKGYHYKRYLEIGTARGYSVACALQALNDEIDADTKIVTIDRSPNVVSEAQRNVASLFREETVSHVNFIVGESRLILKGVTQNFDLVFVDGGHAFEDVITDGQWAIDHCCGHIVFDDYNPRVYPSVVAACDCLISDNPGQWILVDDDRQLYQPELKNWEPHDLHGSLVFHRKRFEEPLL